MNHNGRDITVSVALSQHVRQMQRSLDRKLEVLVRRLTSSSVHACRTQTRRLRAFLRTFRHAFEPSVMARYKKVLRRLTHDLSSARSAHVEQQIIARMAKDQGIRNDDGWRGLRAIAAYAHARAVMDLTAMMTGEAWLRRLGRMRRAASNPALIVESSLPMAVMTARILRRRRRRLRRQLRLHRKSPKQLHKFRLQIKTLRYLLERCVPDETAVRAEIKQLRLLQDRLGELHDEWTLQSRLARQPRYLRASNDICSRIRGHRDELLHIIEKHENHLLRIWKQLDRRRDRRTTAAAQRKTQV